MQRFSPFHGLGAVLIPIVFSLAFGCTSHLATVGTPPQPPSDISGPTTVDAVGPNTVPGLPGLGGVPTNTPVALPEQASPLVVQRDTPAIEIGDPRIPSTPYESFGAVAPSEISRKAQVVVGRFVDTLLGLDGATWMGLAATAAMVVLYGLEDRSPFFTFAFAATCWAGSAYGLLEKSRLIGMAGGIWGCVALRKWWRRIQSKKDTEDGVVIWPVRVIGILAVLSGVVLLIVDSPLSAELPIPITRAIAESIPLLLVGVAYLAWLAIDRPPIIDLIKQLFIAVAFILWGINLLMPPGPWTKLVGAVVIAIYVFDLAWLMEGNLRKKFAVHSIGSASPCRAPDCQSSGVCSCEAVYENSGNNGNARRPTETLSASTKPNH